MPPVAERNAESVLERIGEARRRSEEITEHAERYIEEIERTREESAREIAKAVQRLRDAGYLKD